MFFNIRAPDFLSIWLSLFPTKKHGEQKTPLEAPEILDVPLVPPFPRFFSSHTYGQWRNSMAVTS